MTQPSISPAALRGAVDLSGLGQTPPATTGAGTAGAPAGIRVDGTDATFQELVLGTRDVAALVVLWSASHPETQAAVDAAVSAAATCAGRLRVIAVDVQANPAIAAAFQAQQVPMTLGLVAGQPIPLFAGLQPAEEISALAQELLRLATQNGVTGRLPAATDPVVGEEEPLPPLHEAAYQAIERGDLDGAEAAYQQALADSPADSLARAGLAQVRLLQRTTGVDPAAARASAAADPADVSANLLAADLDLLGGHVADAFSRLIDLVRRTAEAERDRVRQHLLELFEVVGPGDERVVKARRALMSALF